LERNPASVSLPCCDCVRIGANVARKRIGMNSLLIGMQRWNSENLKDRVQVLFHTVAENHRLKRDDNNAGLVQRN